jgi:hypothetical protein
MRRHEGRGELRSVQSLRPNGPRVGDRHRWLTKRFVAPWVAVAAIAALTATPAGAVGPVDRFVFTPVADTYVNASTPATSYGTSSTLLVDASPQAQSFLRFNLGNLMGRTIQDVRLRMYQQDASPLGGRVFSITSNSWSESITWNTRPPIDGPQLGSYGPVSTGIWYEADLSLTGLTDGPLSLAIDTTSSNGVKWASRQSLTQPQLIVEVDQIPGLVLDGLSQVANSYIGSSDPTWYASEHHIAMTSGGRTLAVHGRHKSGVQLTWRDPGGGWQTQSQGDVKDGLLVPSPGSTGDWPASIVVGHDSVGNERAWVVWSGVVWSSPKPVQMRRLSDLDSPNGPTVGPVVTVESTGLGNVRTDLGFEELPGGGGRGVISYYHRSSDTSYDFVVEWFTDLDTDTPALQSRTVLFSSSINSLTGTVEQTPAGVDVVARGNSSKLWLYMHDRNAPLDTWTQSAVGYAFESTGRPCAVVLSSGEILVAGSYPSTGVTKVIRFSANGSTVKQDLAITGYSQASIASDGVNAWLVAIRKSDGLVVSREYRPASGWTTVDRVEIGPEGGGNYQWPNLVRSVDGRLRIITRGGPFYPREDGKKTQSTVLAYQRTT